MLRNAVLMMAVAVTLLLAMPPGAHAQMDKLASTTPQERAKLQTEFMKTRLDLTPEQVQSVGALNLKYAQRMDPVIKGSEGPLMKMRQAREINEAKEAELKGLLSPPQFEKYLASREEMREKFGRKMEEKSRQVALGLSASAAMRGNARIFRAGRAAPEATPGGAGAVRPARRRPPDAARPRRPGASPPAAAGPPSG